MTTTTCDRCGCEGERGDQPGEGNIVHCGGEAALAPYGNGKLCDECADALFAAHDSVVESTSRSIDEDCEARS